MTNIRNALMQAAGTAASGDPVYVEDVFSTHLYTGTGSGIAINNGIDLSGEGGLVIYRRRDGAENWSYQDTERGVDSVVYSDANGAAANPGGYGLASFNSNGFTTELNTSSAKYCSWTFRKQEGFFDVVKFSTTGGGGTQAVSHNLGSIPGVIILKRLTSSGDQNWYVFHKSVTSPSSDWWINYGMLNSSTSFANWGSTTGITSAPTSSAITLSTYYTNTTADYVAYFFAEGGSDDQIFGEDGDEAIIKTGSYTADSSNAYAVNLGFEPQWLMIKRSSGTGDWEILDNMRGVTYDPADGQFLEANNNNAEFSDYGAYITSTGFVGSNQSGANGASYVYIAIRRGPMKEPTAGTDILDIETYTGDGASTREFSFDITPDFIYQNNLGGDTYSYTVFYFKDNHASSLSSSGTITSSLKFDRTKGVHATGFENTLNQSSESYIMYAFKRYPKAIDITHWESFDETTLSSFNHPHNLGVKPEVMIFKAWWKVSGSSTPSRQYRIWWDVAADNKYSTFTTVDTAASWLSDPTATHIILSTNNDMSFYDVPGPNVWGYQAILMASLDGIIDIGRYDHASDSTSTITVTTGFQPRLIILQGEDNKSWAAFDSVRGLTSTNDPYFHMPSTNAQVTNQNNIHSITSTGFVINSENGGAEAEFNYAGSGLKTRYIAIA